MNPRLGITFGGEVPLPDLVQYSRQAEAQGFDSLWMAEHYCLRDAFTSMAAAAAATHTIKIGSGVINPYTRSTPLIAMSIAAIDELAEGRTFLGWGSTNRFWTNLGITDDQPVHTLRESIQLTRRLLAGETVTHQGRRETLQQIHLGFPPHRKTIPMYVGAVQKRMLQLAGEIADGALLSNLATTDYVTYALQQIRAGAERRGRSLSQLDLACYAMTWLRDDAAKVVPALKRQIATLLAVPGREILFGAEGVTNPAVLHVIDAAKKGRIDEAAASISDDLLHAVTISGTAAECTHRLHEYFQAGVKVVVIRPVGTAPDRLIDALASE